jgi:hypothetical protein
VGWHRHPQRLSSDDDANRTPRQFADRCADHRRLSRDKTTIPFAGMIEREFGGFTPPPGYA